MKTFKNLLLIAAIVSTAACKKNNDSNTVNNDHYTSMTDFHIKNGVTMQTYKIKGSAGGSFTTPQGTIVTIHANAFVNTLWMPVADTVTIQFKDIYSKSDMLLSDMPTVTYDGTILKSGGEFFIKATYLGSPVLLAQPITIRQPLGGIAADNNMAAFMGLDTVMGGNNGIAWMPVDTTCQASVATEASNYVFTLYAFSDPVDSGTWCNSDNSSYFSAYPQTTLTIKQADTTNYGAEIFILFKNLRSMVHVYKTGSNYSYNYAPTGLEATVVAVGTKEGKLYSSFTPVTITNNMTVTFDMTPTTTEVFKQQVEALN